ncbi:hypothetical protein, partial [Bradyrhizobium liaoningense]|uniref:hypothetical protein n=1 Tax=Bradyrhizobium liaoningense TaxID=43992 RepID=UPI001BA4F4AE
LHLTGRRADRLTSGSFLRVVPALRHLCVSIELRTLAAAQPSRLYDAIENCATQDEGADKHHPERRH